MKAFIAITLLAAIANCLAADTREAPTNTVHVPATLEEAHAELFNMLDDSTLQAIKEGPDDVMNDYHHGLGTWIRNNWNLWRGGPLASYFNNMGIFHPDDMSGLILDTFWCKIHEQPFRLPERVADYQEYWRSITTPTNGSPKDGATIQWVIQTGGGTAITHLGISTSDRSFWRYQFPNAEIQSATSIDSQRLEELIHKWGELGTTPEFMQEK